MLIFIKRITVLLVILILTGCAGSLENLTVSKNKVQAYYESGEYEKELNVIFNDAVEKFEKVKIDSNTAVVFDVDETALSNYKIIKEIDFGYVKEIWSSWVLQGKTPANAPVKNFYNYLLKKDVKIIFLTGRAEEQHKATFNNLVNAGYTKFDTLIVYSKNYANLGSAEFKFTVRKQLTEKGYKIIGTVGDQYTDIDGGYTGIKIKLPNYLYMVE